MPEVSVSDAARVLSSRRWADPEERRRAGAAMYKGRLLSAARALDPDGTLGLEKRAERLLAERQAVRP